MKSDTCETRLSDHHKMVYLFLRKTFAKGKPKTIYYRCFKNFAQNKFNDELKKRISIDLSSETFLEIFQSILNRFAPLEIKKVRYNNNPFFSITLCRTKIKIKQNTYNSAPTANIE